MASETVDLVITSNPMVTVNSPGICEGGDATIIATVSGGQSGYTYVWTVPPGAGIPGNVSSFNATVAGNYSVVVTDANNCTCLLYTSPSPRDGLLSRMPSSA